jgi:hypothetical protein
MIRQAWFAVIAPLALALPAPAQNPPTLELTPLVPPSAPWLKKNQKKKKIRKKVQPAPSETQPEPGAPFVAAPPPAVPPLPQPEPAKPAEPAPTVAVPPSKPAEPAPTVAAPPSKPLPAELPLPPLQLPALVPLIVTTVGVVFQNDGLDPAAAARVDAGLRGVAKTAPLIRLGPVLARPAQPCADDACLAVQAATQSMDQLLVASYAKGALRVRLFDVAKKKTLSEEQHQPVAADGAEATAWAQLLACKLLMPAGCSAYAKQVDDLSRPTAKPVPQAAVAAEPAARRNWTRPVGYAALGAGGVALGVGAVLGAISRSDINKAESAFRANGGAFRPGDADRLASGNSKARSANALFIASGVLLAAGAIFTLAF